MRRSWLLLYEPGHGAAGFNGRGDRRLDQQQIADPARAHDVTINLPNSRVDLQVLLSQPTSNLVLDNGLISSPISANDMITKLRAVK